MKRFVVFIIVTIAMILGVCFVAGLQMSPDEAGKATAQPMVEIRDPDFTRPALAPLIIVRDREASFETRFEALHSVVLDTAEASVAQAQQEVLLSVLEDHDAHATLRNDIVLVLARDGVPRPGLGGKLVDMWRDPSESSEWRDYCLQHLETVFDLDPDNQEAMRRALLEASDPDRRHVTPMPGGSTAEATTEMPPIQPTKETIVDVAATRPTDGTEKPPPTPPTIITPPHRNRQVTRSTVTGESNTDRRTPSNIIVADGQYRPEVKAVLDDNPGANRSTEASGLDIRDLPDASAATALLAMDRLGKRHPDFRTESMRVARKALEHIERQPDYAVAALQVLARGDDAAALVKARTLAMNPAYPERLRMSALWVISAKGDSPSDLATLRQAAADKDFRIASAGKAGVARWREHRKTLE